MKLLKKTKRTGLISHSFALGVFTIVFIFMFLATSFVVANGQTLGPNDSHLVNLYIDGQITAVPTRANNVKDFLEKMDIKLYEADLVEPGLYAPITQDDFNIQIYRARPVTVVDGSTIKRVLSPHTSAKLIVEQAGFTVYPEDNLIFTSPTSFTGEMILGEKLIIDRATPVNFSLYSAPTAIYRTQADTVDGFLQEQGIVLEEGATVVPAGSTAISANMPIFVSKFGKQVVAVEEDVNFAIESNRDPSKYINEVTVVQAGIKGKKQVIYELELKDGVEISRRILSEVITLEPQAQIQTVGTKTPDVTGDKVSWMQAAGIAESDFYFVDYIITAETHWRPDAINSSGCIGLGQNCPTRDGYYWLKEACSNWQNDPVCQLKRFSAYAGRYGGWQGAYDFWKQNRWW